MPFTPFHLGPALLICCTIKRRIHPLTIFVSSVIVDIEPLVVLVLSLRGPLHGYTHTLMFAIVGGSILGYVMFMLESALALSKKMLPSILRGETGVWECVTAGIIGIALHVLLDAPLYSDIRPLYPLDYNPLYGAVSPRVVYQLSIASGLIAIVYCLSTSWRRPKGAS